MFRMIITAAVGKMDWREVKTISRKITWDPIIAIQDKSNGNPK